MSIALDIGNTRLRSLRRENYRLIGRSCRSAYVSMPNRESRRRMLDRLNVPCHEVAEQLIVVGDGTDDVAELFRLPVKQLLPCDLSVDRPVVISQIVAAFCDSLLPGSAQTGEVCCFTAGPPEGRGAAVQRHLMHDIQRRGYRPLGIGGATAVVLAELGDHALTGVGITFGSARCEVSLVRHGVELARSAVERGGDWIDEQLARGQSLSVWDRDGNQQIDVRAAQEWKESNEGMILNPESRKDYQLAALYRDLVSDVVDSIHEASVTASNAFDALEPITIICAGGTSYRPGFREVVLGELRGNPLPFAVEQVQVVRNWEYSAARGCLIRAALEEQTALRRAA